MTAEVEGLATSGRLCQNLWPETGQAMGLSKNATYEAAKRGEIPIIQIGRRKLVPIAALNKLLSGE